MSNAFSYWNGQTLNATGYPPMGDLMQSQAGGAAPPPPPPAAAAVAPGGGFAASGWSGQTRTPAQSTSSGPYPSAGGAGLCLGQGGMAMQRLNPGAQMGMGDYGNVSSPLTCNLPTNFFNQGQGQFEPCIDNGEAFCAYNGMDMSMNYGGGQGKEGFW